MPFKDPEQRAEQQRAKFRLWREMVDGFARKATCVHCGVDCYALDPARHSTGTDRWYHFCDPKALGARPLGKNEPVYDLVRTCATALRHRYVPEVIERTDGTFDGFDPRTEAYEDLRQLTEAKIATVGSQCVATPKE